MAVLSDDAIRRRIQAGGLVLGADPTRALDCSYGFVGGKAFHPGRRDPPILFPDEVLVPPGEMIWIRTRERVKLPSDLAGFWWQTNGLSRRGLMLVNMSMIEPNYEGDLACLFVNFGKSTIPIYAETVIAKMVFMQLTDEVSPRGQRVTPTDIYDGALRDLSIDQPPSFLQIGELASNLDTARSDALKAVADAANAERAGVAKSIADATAAAGQAISDRRVAEVTKFEGNIKDSIIGSLGWAAGALALLTMATLGANWVKGELTPDVKSVAHSEAQKTLDERVSIAAAPRSDDAGRLDAEIERLNARIAALEKKK